MKHLFYFLAIFPLIWEAIVITETKRVFLFLKGFKLLRKEKAKIDKYTSNQKLFILLNFGYLVWSFMGLFTFQWIMFLPFFLLGLIPKPYVWVKFIEGLITLLLIVFILINAYHLKIDIFAWLKSV